MFLIIIIIIIIIIIVINTLQVSAGGEKRLMIRPRSSVGDEVMLSVETVPQHGRLLLVDNRDGRREIEMTPVMTSTSLNDLLDDDVGVVYRHDGSQSPSDRFTLALTQQSRHRATSTCHVTVQVPAHVTTNSVLRVQEGGSAIITSDNLRATKADGDDDRQVRHHLHSPVFHY